MPVIATLSDIAVAAPVAFVLGLLTGLLLSSHFRLVRRPSDNETQKD